MTSETTPGLRHVITCDAEVANPAISGMEPCGTTCSAPVLVITPHEGSPNVERTLEDVEREAVAAGWQVDEGGKAWCPAHVLRLPHGP